MLVIYTTRLSEFKLCWLTAVGLCRTVRRCRRRAKSRNAEGATRRHTNQRNLLYTSPAHTHVALKPDAAAIFQKVPVSNITESKHTPSEEEQVWVHQVASAAYNQLNIPPSPSARSFFFSAAGLSAAYCYIQCHKTNCVYIVKISAVIRPCSTNRRSKTLQQFAFPVLHMTALLWQQRSKVIRLRGGGSICNC